MIAVLKSAREFWICISQEADDCQFPQFRKSHNVKEEAKASIAENVDVGYQLMSESVLPFLKD